MAQKLINRPTLSGFSVQSLSVLEPRTDRYSKDPSSAPIRWGDPVKQIAGGNIIRCVPTDTQILGIAKTGDNNVLPRSIASAPLLLDAAGNSLITVYQADALTIFTGNTVVAPVQANILQLHDFSYTIPDSAAPTPTITNVGTAGNTAASYTIGALTPHGETLQGLPGTTATGNAVLSATNYNLVTIPAVSRATMFNVYKNGLLIGSAAAVAGGNTLFKDIGQPAIAGAPATVNMTGWLVNNTAQATNVLQIRSIDTKPVQPFINTFNVGAVLFAIAAPKSQVQDVAGV